MAVRGYRLAVDFSGSGDFTGTYDDVSSNLLDNPELTVSYGRDVSQALAPLAAGSMSFALRNDSRLYSPENTTSPLFDKVLPGRKVQLTYTPTTGFTPLTTHFAFEATADGWVAESVGASVVRSTTTPLAGVGSLVATKAMSAGTDTLRFNDASALGDDLSAFGDTVQVRVRARGVNAGTNVTVRLEVQNPSFVWQPGPAYPITVGTGGVYGTAILVRFTPAPGLLANCKAVGVHVEGTGLNGSMDVQIDNVQQGAGVTAAVTLFDSVIDDFSVDPHAPARDFTAEALDAWGRPGAEKLSTAVYQGIRTGTAVGLILDAIGWDGARDIDPGATVMPWWWEDDSDASTAISRLVASEGPPAAAHVQGNTFVFRDRHHRITREQSRDAQATFTHVMAPAVNPTGAYKIKGRSFGYDHGLQGIANAVGFTVEQRQPGLPEEVWSSTDPISLPAGETQTIIFRTSDPFINATPLVELQSGAATATLSRTNGQSAVITLTGGTGVIARLAVVANAIKVTCTRKVEVDSPQSIARHGGTNTWPGEVPFANQYDALAIAQRIIALYAENRSTVTFAIDNLDTAYTEQIATRRIGDRVIVRNDELGINREFIIDRITHTIVKLGLIHTMALGCTPPEPAQAANPLTFDVAGSGFNDGAFAVTGIDNPTTVFRFDTAGQGFDQGVFSY